VTNWDAVAEALIQRVHREAVGGVEDATTSALLRELLAYPDVPPRLRRLDLSRPLLPVLPICFRKGDQAYDYFSTVTTLGTAQDITLQELRIESFFPANDATRDNARTLPSL
jgi:hypothetical protein